MTSKPSTTSKLQTQLIVPTTQLKGNMMVNLKMNICDDIL